MGRQSPHPLLTGPIVLMNKRSRLIGEEYSEDIVTDVVTDMMAD